MGLRELGLDEDRCQGLRIRLSGSPSTSLITCCSSTSAFLNSASISYLAAFELVGLGMQFLTVDRL
jgi:hypothetical protein